MPLSTRPLAPASSFDASIATTTRRAPGAAISASSLAERRRYAVATGPGSATMAWATDGTAHASLNHYSKGAVISFLHQYVAGLQLVEPGYRSFRVEPRPGGGITRARVHHDSPHGRIETHWTLDHGHGRISVSVPDNTECALDLPDGTGHTLRPGDHERTWQHP